MKPCTSCHAPLLWALTSRGKRMPLDADPVNLDELESYAGLFVLVDGNAIAATPDQMPGRDFYRSHFATCPHADQWRRK